MPALHKDPLVRRLVSGSLFAGAFIWVAATYFNVDWEIIRVFFVFSVLLVVGLVIAAVLFVPVIRLFRKPRSRLLEGQERDPDQSPD